jgi:hypothetical protein
MISASLTTTSQVGELLIKWDQNTERDLAGYEIGFGLVNDTSQFIYTRTMGPKEIVTGTSSIVDAKLWGLTDDTEVFYGGISHIGRRGLCQAAVYANRIATLATLRCRNSSITNCKEYRGIALTYREFVDRKLIAKNPPHDVFLWILYFCGYNLALTIL